MFLLKIDRIEENCKFKTEMIRSKHVQIIVPSEDLKCTEIELEVRINSYKTSSPNHNQSNLSDFDSENSLNDEKLMQNEEDENIGEK